ncbi:MAG: DUF4112 domain-containing protein [Muribaculaceae bacterium]|nr:DUF4112 domain-containing protein [Muribaculaceae bacterium]MBR1726598.1 DUF4112 domain-containing protein [Muribaculaceae bacterium]
MDKLAKHQQRQQAKESKVYRMMEAMERYMDRYYLDAIIGFIPGWGDAISLLCAAPFVYFSARVVKSVPLTLAVINNALRDILLGLIPFFVGDIIDVFHRSNSRNMAMVRGFVEGDQVVIKQVNQRAWQAVAILIALLALIALMIWLLISFGQYLFSLL